MRLKHSQYRCCLIFRAKAALALSHIQLVEGGRRGREGHGPFDFGHGAENGATDKPEFQFPSNWENIVSIKENAFGF